MSFGDVLASHPDLDADDGRSCSETNGIAVDPCSTSRQGAEPDVYERGGGTAVILAGVDSGADPKCDMAPSGTRPADRMHPAALHPYEWHRTWL